MSGADDRNQSTRESEAVLISVGEIGGLFQSYKLRGISRYVSRYGPPYRGIPRYGNLSRYPPLKIRYILDIHLCGKSQQLAAA